MEILRKGSLLLAGFVTFVAAFHIAKAHAETAIPKPTAKPQLIHIEPEAAAVPVPTAKPVLESVVFVQDPVEPVEPKEAKEKKKYTPASSSFFSERQARLYREIFALQEKGDIRAADEVIKLLKNPILLGHVYAERYMHPTHYKTSYAELKSWMQNYADHPQAEKIYQTAVSKRPASFIGGIQEPAKRERISGNLLYVSKRGKNYRTSKKRSAAEEKRVAKLKTDVRRHVERYEPTLALNILSNDYALQFMDNVEHDRLKALIAAGYLYAGKLDKAKTLANEALNRSGGFVPQAGWVKGLVNWQSADYRESAEGFESAATSPYASGWMVSAAAYWASRSHLRAGNVTLVSSWLEQAATYPRTFYGLIATRALGYDSNFDWTIPALTRSYVKFVESTQKGKRAAALLRIGRADLAEAELNNITIDGSISKQKALLAYAHYHNLPSLSIRLGNAFNNSKGGLYDAALYPIPSWQPRNGYRVSPALIHAIVRQESRFNIAARNPSGATGLMQLMPSTADYIAGEGFYEQRNGKYELKKPEVNLELGQTYIEKLLENKAVENDLLSLAIAYNAGPGKLARWKKERSHIHDPLMFIETIPYHETRAFVERVMANYWIYRMRFNQPTPSLDAVTEGKWARYAEGDASQRHFAAIH